MIISDLEYRENICRSEGEEILTKISGKGIWAFAAFEGLTIAQDVGITFASATVYTFKAPSPLLNI